ncbi:TRAP transporter small permease subunit [Roseovarius sp. CH_XMU1461]|uniref:TRAP transporter small permease subunit n=1 Tax=Roseovarius sp. CH_XMU1461 TaxID=3107777 RepID=UPI003008BF2A
MTGLLRLCAGIDTLNTAIGHAMRWAVLAAVLISAVNAVMRRVFSMSSNGWLEVQWYLFGAVFLLAAAHTLRRDEHVRIDFLSSRMKPRTFVRMTLFGHLFFLLPFCLVMLWLSAPWALSSILSGETSANAGGLPLWPAKAIVPLGFILLSLQAIAEIIRSNARLSGALPLVEQKVGAHQGMASARQNEGRS